MNFIENVKTLLNSLKGTNVSVNKDGINVQTPNGANLVIPVKPQTESQRSIDCYDYQITGGAVLGITSVFGGIAAGFMLERSIPTNESEKNNDTSWVTKLVDQSKRVVHQRMAPTDKPVQPQFIAMIGDESTSPVHIMAIMYIPEHVCNGMGTDALAYAYREIFSSCIVVGSKVNIVDFNVQKILSELKSYTPWADLQSPYPGRVCLTFGENECVISEILSAILNDRFYNIGRYIQEKEHLDYTPEVPLNEEAAFVKKHLSVFYDGENITPVASDLLKTDILNSILSSEEQTQTRAKPASRK